MTRLYFLELRKWKKEFEGLIGVNWLANKYYNKVFTGSIRSEQTDSQITEMMKEIASLISSEQITDNIKKVF